MTTLHWKLASLAAAVFVAVFAAGSPGPASAGGGGCHPDAVARTESGTNVVLQRSCFSPIVLHTEPGTEVIFRNSDPMSHWVQGAAFAWGHNRELTAGEAVTVSFPTAGTYPYSCFLHPGMTGAIVVGDGKPSSAAVQQAAKAPAAPISEVRAAPPAPDTGAAAPLAAATTPPESSDANPLLFTALGALIGAVTVALAIAAKAIRARS